MASTDEMYNQNFSRWLSSLKEKLAGKMVPESIVGLESALRDQFKNVRPGMIRFEDGVTQTLLLIVGDPETIKNIRPEIIVAIKEAGLTSLREVLENENGESGESAEFSGTFGEQRV